MKRFIRHILLLWSSAILKHANIFFLVIGKAKQKVFFRYWCKTLLMSPRKGSACHIWHHVWLTFTNIVIAREHMAYLTSYSRVRPTGPWSYCLLLLHRCGREKINSDARQKPPPQIHDLNPKANLSEEWWNCTGLEIQRLDPFVVVLVRGNVRTPDVVNRPEFFWQYNLNKGKEKYKFRIKCRNLGERDKL